MNKITNNIKTNSVATFTSALFILLSFSHPSTAGFKKWLKTEVKPTLQGKRPLKVKPHITIKHKGKERFRLNRNQLFIQVGSVTVQTHQLRKRLIQAGCILETGDVAVCAKDVINREARKLASGR